MGAKNVNLAPKFSKNGDFLSQIVHFWTKIFGQELRFFDDPKFKGGQLTPLVLPATTPLSLDIGERKRVSESV